jgi:hypothetical protein
MFPMVLVWLTSTTHPLSFSWDMASSHWLSWPLKYPLNHRVAHHFCMWPGANYCRGRFPTNLILCTGCSLSSSHVCACSYQQHSQYFTISLASSLRVGTLLYLSVDSQNLVQCLAHSRYSINSWWWNRWRTKECQSALGVKQYELQIRKLRSREGHWITHGHIAKGTAVIQDKHKAGVPGFQGPWLYPRYLITFHLEILWGRHLGTKQWFPKAECYRERIVLLFGRPGFQG